MKSKSLGIRFANAGDVQAIVDVLREAAEWMGAVHRPLWSPDALGADYVRALVQASSFVVAESGAQLAGVCTLHRNDPCFWPEDGPGEAAYLHKLAVRRAFAGGAVTRPLVAWCAATARTWGCVALKLDCDPPLRAAYERLGFTRLDQRQIFPPEGGSFIVDRFHLHL